MTRTTELKELLNIRRLILFVIFMNMSGFLNFIFSVPVDLSNFYTINYLFLIIIGFTYLDELKNALILSAESLSCAILASLILIFLSGEPIAINLALTLLIFSLEKSKLRDAILFYAVFLFPFSIISMMDIFLPVLFRGIIAILSFGIASAIYKKFEGPGNEKIKKYELFSYLTFLVLIFLICLSNLNFSKKNREILVECGKNIACKESEENLFSKIDPKNRSYKNLIELLKISGYKITFTKELSKEALKEKSIYLTIMRDTTYKEEEINLIQDFLKNGGSMAVFCNYEEAGNNFIGPINSLLINFGITFNNEKTRHYPVFDPVVPHRCQRSKDLSL